MTMEKKIIRNKVGLLEFAKQLGSMLGACKIFGYSRDSFYRFKHLYEKGGEEALYEVSKKKPNVKNRVSPDAEEAVYQIAVEFPAYGQVRVANELRKKGIFVSPGGVISVWQRHNLETFRKRLKALEEMMANERFILTESQLVALEKARYERKLQVK